MTPAEEQFSPQLLYHLLAAARRCEPQFCHHLCRQLHVEIETILGLFGQLDLLEPGQLMELLAALRSHTAYGEIVFLAGRNAFKAAVAVAGERALGGGPARFVQLTKQLLPPLLGRGTQHILAKGNLQFVEVGNSVFAREARSLRPLCGFYAGFLSECGRLVAEGRSAVSEVHCRATAGNATNCLFQVAV